MGETEGIEEREEEMKGGLVGRKRSGCLAAVAVASEEFGGELRKLWKCELQQEQGRSFMLVTALPDDLDQSSWRERRSMLPACSLPH